MTLGTLEYDHNVHTAPNAGDDSLLVKFFIDVVEDPKASLKEGRPMFKDAEWVDIRIPGNRDNVVIRPARDTDKQRFPRHYAAFKQRVASGNAEVVEGTPLHAWPYPRMTPQRVKELDFFNIRTVEQLANTSDSAGGKLHGFQEMKQAAASFLEAAKAQQPVQALQKQVDELSAVVKKQAALIEKLSQEE